VDVNLTSESRVKLELNVKLPFTYEVIWKEAQTKFVDRFDKYLDPNFFQHRVTWDRCYDFLNIFAEKFSEKIGVFCINYC
jgi:hypothetical protein